MGDTEFRVERNGVRFVKTIPYKNHWCAGCRRGILTNADVHYWQSEWDKNDARRKQTITRYHLDCLPDE